MKEQSSIGIGKRKCHSNVIYSALFLKTNTLPFLLLFLLLLLPLLFSSHVDFLDYFFFFLFIRERKDRMQ